MISKMLEMYALLDLEQWYSSALSLIYTQLNLQGHWRQQANVWLGVSFLAPIDSLESISFFAYKVEFFLFFL
jgi:hypothetical protein